MDFITNKQMYNDALKLFHIEIRQVQKGHLVFVTDGIGNQIRHPIKMSDFEERPRFYKFNGIFENIWFDDQNFDKTTKLKENQYRSRLFVDLIRLIQTYSDKNNHSKKRQLINRNKKRLRR
jgi:hypothetical protein